MSDALAVLVSLLIFGGIALRVLYSTLSFSRAWKLRSQIMQGSPLFCGWPLRYRLVEAGSRAVRWRLCLLAITTDGLTLYPMNPRMTEKIAFAPGDLRWFGRPKKYTAGTNEIWLHLERDHCWYLLRIRASQYFIQPLVRALKAIASADQVIAYRRRRPYIHHGPVRAHPAEQDIHGAWTLDDPVHLYLTPAFLVILRQGAVLRVLPLAGIQQIGALKRLDAPEDGLARFQMEGEPFAFALPDCERFAAALAEAAKRTLEAPFVQKGKELEDFDTDYDQQDYVNIIGEYVITDDGELQARR